MFFLFKLFSLFWIPCIFICFRIHFSMLLQKGLLGLWLGIVLNLWNHLRIATLTILRLPIHELAVSHCLFVCYLFLKSVFCSFQCINCTHILLIYPKIFIPSTCKCEVFKINYCRKKKSLIFGLIFDNEMSLSIHDNSPCFALINIPCLFCQILT